MKTRITERGFGTFLDDGEELVRIPRKKRNRNDSASTIKEDDVHEPRGPFPYGWDHTELIEQDRQRTGVPEAAAALHDLLTNYHQCTTRDIFEKKVKAISEGFISVKNIVDYHKFPEEKNFMPADEFISLVSQYKNNVYSIATLFAEPMLRPPPPPPPEDDSNVIVVPDDPGEAEVQFKSPYVPKIMFKYQDGTLSFVDAIQSPYAVFNSKGLDGEPPSIEVLRQMTDADSDLMRGKNFVFHSAVVQWDRKAKGSMLSSAGHFAAVLRGPDGGLWLVDNMPVKATRINDIGDIRGNGFNYVTFAIFANKNVWTDPYDPPPDKKPDDDTKKKKAQKPDDDIKVGTRVGIKNFGNTCWFAAPLMALTGLPLFENVLKDLATDSADESLQLGVLRQIDLMDGVSNMYNEGFSGAPVVQVLHRLPNPPTGREVFGDTIAANPQSGNGDESQEDEDRSDERRYLEAENIYQEEGRLSTEQVGPDTIATPGDLYDDLGTSRRLVGEMENEGDAFYGNRPY